MSEAKWWPKGTIPDEPGYYLAVGAVVVGWKFPNDKPSLPSPDRRFYGPIPDPPKEPPKIGRFTAIHRDYGLVSGVYCPSAPEAYSYACFFQSDGKVEGLWAYPKNLSDFTWLDKE